MTLTQNDDKMMRFVQHILKNVIKVYENSGAALLSKRCIKRKFR